MMRPDRRDRRRKGRGRRVTAVLLVVGSLGTACGNDGGVVANDASATGDSTGSTIATNATNIPDGVIETWVNQTGLSADDPSSWGQRLTEACAAPIWDPVAAEPLASRFVDEDGGDSSDMATVENAAAGLWQMAINVCPEQFTDDARSRGPVFDFGG